MALPTRRPRPNSTHQWAGTSPSCQEACTRPASLTRGQTLEPRKLQFSSLQTKSINSGQTLARNQLVPGPWVTRGECTARTLRTSPTEGHLSKVEKPITQVTSLLHAYYIHMYGIFIMIYVTWLLHMYITTNLLHIFLCTYKHT